MMSSGAAAAGSGWLSVTLPSTVLAGLVANGRYPNLYYGTNLKSVPDAPFQVPWWYRRTFHLDSVRGRTSLVFDGINFRAAVWVNGRRVATPEQVAGTFRTFELDVTRFVHPGANTVAVEVYPVSFQKDLTLTWVDWNPIPPDRGMGIWHDVWLRRNGSVSIRDPQVRSAVSDDRAWADLTVTADVHNASDEPARAEVRGTIGSIRFSRSVTLAAGETRTVSFGPSAYPQLRIAHPRLWWPAGMGPPAMSHLSVAVEVGGGVSDRDGTDFGIRQVRSRLNADGFRQFLVNGRPVLIRGAGWAPDLLLREQHSRVRAQLLYARSMGLNTVRLEGKLESDWFLSQADRLGIMVMPGWMCCDRWQFNDHWTSFDHRVAVASMDSQARRMRSHPSVIAFLIGSDEAPPRGIEQGYLDALRRDHWPDPILSSASDTDTPALPPSGVKMTGPYEWIAPAYWYAPRADGGAWGFNTETSDGPSIPPLESLRSMLTPAELTALWRYPKAVQYHAGSTESGGIFSTLRRFDRALFARMGRPVSLADYVEKAQLMNYEGERAMFEAFNRQRDDDATGVVQWMLNNAWPSLHWNLFGYDLSTNGSTYGAMEANRPLHLQYSYDDNSIVLVNGTARTARRLRAEVATYDPHGRRLSSWSTVTAATPDHARRLTILRRPARSQTSAYLVALRLRSPSGRLIDANTYWLSTAPDRIDWRHSRWFVTPTSRYADLRALATMPRIRPGVHACVRAPGHVRVTLDNDSRNIALFLTATLLGHQGSVRPAYWSDNDVTLIPGEHRILTVRYTGDATAVHVSGASSPGGVTVPLVNCR